MITAAQLQQYESAGIVAAARALKLHTSTIHRLARQLGVKFKADNTLAEQYRRERQRKALASKVRKLASKCMTQADMCQELGVSRNTLRRIGREHRININSRSLY
jgi:DNA-binding XRE family transcriptional regulator